YSVGLLENNEFKLKSEFRQLHDTLHTFHYPEDFWFDVEALLSALAKTMMRHDHVRLINQKVESLAFQGDKIAVRVSALPQMPSFRSLILAAGCNTNELLAPLMARDLSQKKVSGVSLRADSEFT